MPSKDGTMDDEKKSTKDVVNKKQKQFLNQEEKNVGREALRTAVSPFTKKIGTKVKSPNMTPDALQRFYKSSTGAASPLDNSHELKGKLIDEEEYDRYRDRIAMAGGDHRSKETRERSNTPTGKQPKGKTVMQKELEKKYGKGKSALDMVKADHKDEIMDVKKKKDKDVKEGAGLYANIHAKRKRGGKMRKKGAKGAPSAKDFANAAKTAREELDLTQVAEAFGGHIVGKPVKLDEMIGAGAMEMPKIDVGAAVYGGIRMLDQIRRNIPNLGIKDRTRKVFDKIKNVMQSAKKETKKETNKNTTKNNEKTDQNRRKKYGPGYDGKVNVNKKFEKDIRGGRRVKVTGDVEYSKTNPAPENLVKKKLNKQERINKRKKAEEIIKDLKKVDKKEVEKLKTIDKNKKVDTNVDSQSNVTDNPLKDALTKVDKKTLQKIGGVAGGAGVLIGVDQLTKNKNKTQTDLQPSPVDNKKKTALNTTTSKKGKKGGIGGFRFPSTQHTVGRRSNPQ